MVQQILKKRLAYSLIAFSLFSSSVSMKCFSQSYGTPDRMRLYNKEYNVFMELSLSKQDIKVPSHEIYGPVAGYLGKRDNSFYWIVVGSEQKGNTYTLQMVNDYGSEDLEASLKQKSDSVFEFSHRHGSTLKLPEKGKWQKMPQTLLFHLESIREAKR